MEQTKRAVALLVAAGINESSVQVLTGPLSPTGANYSESLKMRSINVFIRSLPKNAYVINSDVDELFSYPCDMERRVTKPDSPSQIWCGLMVDRMASDGKVRALLAEPDISLQFPLPCYMRSHLRSNNKFHKVVLSRVYRTDGATTARAFESAHEIHKMWGHYGSCRLLPSVAGRGQLAHYSMTRQALEFLAGKKSHAFGSNPHQMRDYGKQLKFLRMHLPETADDARQHDWCTTRPRFNLTRHTITGVHQG